MKLCETRDDFFFPIILYLRTIVLNNDIIIPFPQKYRINYIIIVYIMFRYSVIPSTLLLSRFFLSIQLLLVV